MNIDLSKKDALAFTGSLLFNVSDRVGLGGQSPINGTYNGTYNGTVRKASWPGRGRGGFPKFLKPRRYGRADPLPSNNEKGGLIYGIRF